MADKSRVLIQVPYVPSTWHKIDIMIELSQPKPNDVVADLGSGDGRIVRAFAKKGIESHGYEIHCDLALLSESKILDENLDEKAFIHIADFWQEDLSKFSIVIVYGMTSIMGYLEEKLKSELQPGSQVLSSIFHFPTWEPVKQKDNVFLYIA